MANPAAIDQGSAPYWTIDMSIDLAPAISREGHNSFWEAFITDAVEANGVFYGGLAQGCVESEDQQVAILARRRISRWLSARPEVVRFDLSQVTAHGPSA